MNDQDLEATSTNIKYNLVKFKHFYTIENYQSLGIKACNVNLKLPKFPVMMPNTKNVIYFSVKLNPYSNNGYLSAYLCLESELNNIITKFKFSVKKKNNVAITTEESLKFFDINQRESNMISITNSGQYLVDDNVQISVEGVVYEEIIAPLKTIATSSVLKQRVAEDLGDLFTSQEFSDVTISVADTKIKAHKAILAARSSVFRGMFSHESKENSQNLVEITDVQPDVLKDLLHFIYTGGVLMMDSKADELFAAADKYELLELKSMCEEALRTKINIENAVQIIILADLHGAGSLKEVAIDFIKKNGTDIMVTSEWKLMITEYPLLVAEILHSTFT